MNTVRVGPYIADSLFLVVICMCLVGATHGGVVQTIVDATWLTWGSWTPHESNHGHACMFGRTRNCSSHVSSDCPGSDVQTLSFTQPCNSVKPDQLESYGPAHWLEWGEWSSAGTDSFCLYERNRNCSTHVHTDCTGSDSMLLDFHDSCQHVTSDQLNPHWLPWGDWITAGTANYCLLERNRNCSTHTVAHCRVADPNATDSQIRQFNKACEDIPHMSQWNSWTCYNIDQGNGDCVAFRERFCQDQHSVNVSNDKCLGDRTRETAACSSDKCKDPYWLQWKDWNCVREHVTSICYMARLRNCSTGHPNDCDGLQSEVKLCDTNICPAPFWLEWTDWHCDYAGGGCFQSRTRNCSTGYEDDCGGLKSEVKLCDGVSCINGAYWSSWSSFQCDHSLRGVCYMKRYRTCSTNKTDDCPGVHSDVAVCDGVTCKALAGAYWSSWSSYQCDLSLRGVCYMKRYRTCSTNKTDDCPGVSSDVATCDGVSCKASWGTWSGWHCRYTSDHGSCFMQRDRQCSTGKTKDCDGGPSYEVKVCGRNCLTTTSKSTTPTTLTTMSTSTKVPVTLAPTSATTATSTKLVKTTTTTTTTTTTPKTTTTTSSSTITSPTTTKATTMVKANWSMWFYGTCSATCGTGTKQGFRRCSSGHEEDCAGSPVTTAACDSGVLCPVDGGWGSWKTWGDCSTACGAGMRTRTRLCDSPTPAGGGKYCSGDNNSTDKCTGKLCPVDGGWGSWDDWGPCSVTCGDGSRTRFRLCDSPAPAHGGKLCYGEFKTLDTCNVGECPVDGGWGSWQTWGTCSVTCNDGTRARLRFCDNPAPSHSGDTCSGDGSELVTCREADCAHWSQWFYSACSVTLGTGTRQGVRRCSSGHEEDCTGSPIKTETCPVSTTTAKTTTRTTPTPKTVSATKLLTQTFTTMNPQLGSSITTSKSTSTTSSNIDNTTSIQTNTTHHSSLTGSSTTFSRRSTLTTPNPTTSPTPNNRNSTTPSLHSTSRSPFTNVFTTFLTHIHTLTTLKTSPNSTITTMQSNLTTKATPTSINVTSTPTPYTVTTTPTPSSSTVTTTPTPSTGTSTPTPATLMTTTPTPVTTILGVIGVSCLGCHNAPKNLAGCEIVSCNSQTEWCFVERSGDVVNAGCRSKMLCQAPMVVGKKRDALIGQSLSRDTYSRNMGKKRDVLIGQHDVTSARTRKTIGQSLSRDATICSICCDPTAQCLCNSRVESCRFNNFDVIPYIMSKCM